MKTTRMLSRSALLALVTTGIAATQIYAQTYVGSDECKRCHEDLWNEHRVSGHAHSLLTSLDAEPTALPLPEGYSFNDVSYIIGGYRWKARYLDPNGYFITTVDGGTPGRNQFNLESNEWVDYHAGEVNVRFECGQCHTTGYSFSGHQGGLPGIQGTWEFDGVQCERCHGPASDHVFNPSRFNITVNPGVCRVCHVTGNEAAVPASGGFIEHQAQYNEILASPHFFLDCTVCHEPHKQAKFSFQVECTLCHDEQADTSTAFKNLGRRHLARDVGCVDCHMPYAVKSAASFGPFQGDLRSHLFGVTLDEDDTMFNAAGDLANGELTAAYVCLGCHENIVNKFTAQGRPEKAEKWARKKARKIHK